MADTSETQQGFIPGDCRSWFAGRGIDLTGEQQTKTPKALAFVPAGINSGEA